MSVLFTGGTLGRDSLCCHDTSRTIISYINYVTVGLAASVSVDQKALSMLFSLTASQSAKSISLNQQSI